MEKYLLTVQNLAETATYTFDQNESFQVIASLTSEKCNLYYI